jgi:hypothetical protein
MDRKNGDLVSLTFLFEESGVKMFKKKADLRKVIYVLLGKLSI